MPIDRPVIVLTSQLLDVIKAAGLTARESQAALDAASSLMRVEPDPKVTAQTVDAVPAVEPAPKA